MLHDSHYLSQASPRQEQAHLYGGNVHLVADPFMFTMLAKLCRAETQQPEVNRLLEILYWELARIIINHEFPTEEVTLYTRMNHAHPEGNFQARIVDPNTEVASVNLARAGTVPSQVCFDAFNHILNPAGVRQDHIYINRKTNEANEVVGTNLAGTKIGGKVDGRYVVFPDPMGATGSTLVSALEIYSKLGEAKRYIAAHLIVTPEYLRHIKENFPGLVVYAIRLDRGLSTSKALNAVPGTHWDEERGLNDHQYIVPGAGGLGEVINNAYV